LQNFPVKHFCSDKFLKSQIKEVSKRMYRMLFVTKITSSFPEISLSAVHISFILDISAWSLGFVDSKVD